MLWEVKDVVDAVAAWLESKAPRLPRGLATLFLASMLSEPGTFPEMYLKKSKRQEITNFIGIVDILNFGDGAYVHVFLDQFEELFHGRGKKELHELASSMRQIIESCSGLATFVVTLHPGAAMQLRSADGQTLTTVAPLDDRHVVDLSNITPSQAVRLAHTYLDQFRVSDADVIGGNTPFDEDCIKEISKSCDGNIRKTLQTLHYSVEAAVEHAVTHIDVKFLSDNHLEITGQISPQDLELPE